MATFGLDPQSLISALLATQQQQAQQTQQAVESVGGLFHESEQLMQRSLQQQSAVIDQAATNAAEKANIDYQQNKLVENLQQTFNLDQSDANNEIARSLAVVEQARQARAPLREEYNRLASIDVLSNPIGYLLAQIKLPSAAAKVNALADAEDEALQNIQVRTQQLTAAKNVLTANTADATRDLQLKQSETQHALASAQLTADQAKVANQTAMNQMQLFNLQSKAADDQRATIVGVSGIAGRAEAREDARQAREDARADREEGRLLRNMQLQDMLEAKQLQKDEEDRLNSRLKVVSTSLGLQEPMTVKSLKTLTNKKEQMAWLQAAQSGQMGEDLKSSLEFYLGRGNRAGIQQTGGASAYQAAKKMEDAALKYETQGARELAIANQGKQPNRKDAVDRAFKIYEHEVANASNLRASPTDLASSEWDKTYNPYQAQFLSFNRAVDNHPDLAPLKGNVVKVTIDDMVKSGAVQTENLNAEQQQQLLKGIVEKVRARQLDPKKAAADISTYFQGATKYNDALSHPEQFGLPPQEAYFFTLAGSFGDSNRKKMNLLNPTEVENGIVWYVKQQTRPFGVGDAPFAAFR